MSIQPVDEEGIGLSVSAVSVYPVFVMGPSSVVPSLQLLSLVTVDASSVVVLDVVEGVVNDTVIEVSVVDFVICVPLVALVFEEICS